jgi:hypothetical protein
VTQGFDAHAISPNLSDAPTSGLCKSVPAHPMITRHSRGRFAGHVSGALGCTCRSSFKANPAIGPDEPK